MSTPSIPAESLTRLFPILSIPSFSRLHLSPHGEKSKNLNPICAVGFTLVILRTFPKAPARSNSSKPPLLTLYIVYNSGLSRADKIDRHPYLLPPSPSSVSTRSQGIRRNICQLLHHQIVNRQSKVIDRPSSEPQHNSTINHFPVLGPLDQTRHQKTRRITRQERRCRSFLPCTPRNRLAKKPTLRA